MIQAGQNFQLAGQKLFDKVFGRVSLINAFDRTVSIDFRAKISHFSKFFGKIEKNSEKSKKFRN